MTHVCCVAEMPEHVGRPRPSHLVLLVDPEELPPTPAGLAPGHHPLVYRCAGVSRSMAAALRAAAPHAQPNRRVVAVADALMRCGGRLLAARDAIGHAPAVPRGPLVSLPLLR